MRGKGFVGLGLLIKAARLGFYPIDTDTPASRYMRIYNADPERTSAIVQIIADHTVLLDTNLINLRDREHHLVWWEDKSQEEIINFAGLVVRAANIPRSLGGYLNPGTYQLRIKQKAGGTKK